MGYCTVELDRGSGRRGHRGAEVEERLCALTGAEAALVVNNCAAAVLLVLRVLANGKRVLVSRAELVEIGGGFRVPAVLEESGAILTEVGTTNRTHLRDYQAALGPDVGAILRVHHSNFRQLGFVEEVALQELARLGPPLIVDAGSGALFDVGEEPLVPAQLAAGASLVCFSGDKLLGGPQAGIVVGNSELIARLRAQPLFRALRPDKITLAALEATLDDWLRGDPVPVRAMIETPIEMLRAAVEQWRRALPSQVQAEVVEVAGAIGGGSVPGRTWPSVALGIRSPDPEALRAALLEQTPIIVARIQHDTLLLDARTVVGVGQSAELLRGLLSALESVGRS
jgi:L-seryl-tRNA(Ser) seleniumtransferase